MNKLIPYNKAIVDDNKIIKNIYYMLNKVELVCSIYSSIIFFLWFIITVWLNIYNPSSYTNGVVYDITGGANGGL
jgi:hypothetical protein